MNRVLAESRRHPLARCVAAVFVAVALVSVLMVGVETSVSDAVIRDIISMPDGTLPAMRAFIEAVDSPDIEPEARSAMLANPHVWFEEHFGITFEGAVLWTVDKTVLPPEDGQPWFFESRYLGDDPLPQEGLVFSGPDLSLFIQTAQSDGPEGGEPGVIMQRFLEVISGRSQDDWNRLLEIVQEVNRGTVEQQQAFLNDTRAELINYNQRLSAAGTGLYAVDLKLGEEYGGVHFGPVPEGMVLNGQGLAFIGVSAMLVYNSVF